MAEHCQDLELGPNVWQTPIESLLLRKTPVYYYYYHDQTLPGSQIKSKCLAASNGVPCFRENHHFITIITMAEYCQDLKLGPNVWQPLIESMLLGKSPLYYYFYCSQTLPRSRIKSKYLAASSRVPGFGEITILLLFLPWPNTAWTSS